MTLHSADIFAHTTVVDQKFKLKLYFVVEFKTTREKKSLRFWCKNV